MATYYKSTTRNVIKSVPEGADIILNQFPSITLENKNWSRNSKQNPKMKILGKTKFQYKQLP